LVDHQPVKTELLDDVLEFFRIDRFLDVAIHVQFVAVDHTPLFLGRSQHHNRNQLGPRVLTNRSKHIESIDPR